MNFLHGISLTAGGFYAPQNRNICCINSIPKFNNFLNILHNFSSHNLHITNFEMETAAIYSLAKLFNHNAIAVNALINNRMSKQCSNCIEQTIDKLIKETLEIIIS